MPHPTLIVAENALGSRPIMPDTSVSLSGVSYPLPEALRIIALTLQSADAAKQQFPDYRLTRLMSARL